MLVLFGMSSALSFLRRIYVTPFVSHLESGAETDITRGAAYPSISVIFFCGRISDDPGSVLQAQLGPIKMDEIG
jgi:hypothetical protein